MTKKPIIGKTEKEILKLVGLGVLMTASLAVPNLPMALAPFFDTKTKRANTRRCMKRLEEKDLIYLGGDKVELTERGKQLLGKIEAVEIKIEKPENWDNIWHVIAYDIPDESKANRDFFRKKLEELGFKKIQESLFVYPYPCREEVAILAQSLGLAPFVAYLKTERLPRNSELIKMFDLERV